MWSVSPGPLSGLTAQLRIDYEMVIVTVLAVALIVAGIVVVVRVRSWRNEVAPPPTLAEQIQTYQALVDKGEMDVEEFERLKAHLEQKATPTPEK